MPLDPLTLVFALVAIVVIWKLRSVLGERTGTERQPGDIFQIKPRAGPARSMEETPHGFGDRNVIRLPGATPSAPSTDPDRWRDFTPLTTQLAERTGRPYFVLKCLMALGFVCAAGLLLAHSFWAAAWSATCAPASQQSRRPACGRS